jgi:hypothetical protein
MLSTELALEQSYFHKRPKLERELNLRPYISILPVRILPKDTKGVS